MDGCVFRADLRKHIHKNIHKTDLLTAVCSLFYVCIICDVRLDGPHFLHFRKYSKLCQFREHACKAGALTS